MSDKFFQPSPSYILELQEPLLDKQRQANIRSVAQSLGKPEPKFPTEEELDKYAIENNLIRKGWKELCMIHLTNQEFISFMDKNSLDLLYSRKEYYQTVKCYNDLVNYVIEKNMGIKISLCSKSLWNTEADEQMPYLVKMCSEDEKHYIFFSDKELVKEFIDAFDLMK